MVVELQRAEMGELLGDSGVEPGQRSFLFRHRFQLRSVAAAEIAGARGQRKKRQCDNEQPSQHQVCSTRAADRVKPSAVIAQ